MTGFFSLEFWALVLAVAVDVAFSIVAVFVAPRAERWGAEQELIAIDTAPEPPPHPNCRCLSDSPPVVDCKLCGPTPLSLGTDGLCWKCAPVVAVVRKEYAHG